MRIKAFLYISAVIIIVLSAYFYLSPHNKALVTTESDEILRKTWNGYKEYFIDRDGRVMRPKDNDTVSEGQGYAMLRAAWMDDKETFDRCYRWTEDNLSRAGGKGDNLLAWHWKEGRVVDWMPASDADIDYALSLIFADGKWQGQAPRGMDDYGAKAEKVLKDILTLETYLTKSGRLYLAPWILGDAENSAPYPVNPSYYSPAHFRVFYKFSKDKRWEGLTDTTYYILGELSKSFNGISGKGLIPDWCAVSDTDTFLVLGGKNSTFGWESVRIPFRVGLDFLWFKNKEAEKFFNMGFSKFIEDQWIKDKAVYCEYSYDGTCYNKYENAAFYAAYYCALNISRSPYDEEMLRMAQGYIVKNKDKWVYENTEEYYVNSLAWLAEGLKSGRLKNLAKERKIYGK